MWGKNNTFKHNNRAESKNFFAAAEKNYNNGHLNITEKYKFSGDIRIAQIVDKKNYYVFINISLRFKTRSKILLSLWKVETYSINFLF